MIHRVLGLHGPVVSPVGLGTMSWPGCRFGQRNAHDHGFSRVDAAAMVRTALDLGITLFDTAEGYGCGLAEEHLGAALKDAGNPDDVTIVTKIGPLFDVEKVDGRACNLSRGHLLERVDRSLRRLNVDKLDVLLAHWPDPLTPIEETMQAIADLRMSGKVMHFGVSNFPNDLLASALACGPVICNQLPCSLADRSIEDGRRAFCLEQKIGIMAYSPIGKGVLSGKYDRTHLPAPEDYRNQRPHFRENFDSNLLLVEQLRAIADNFSTSTVAVALAWTLNLPGITVAIPGAKSPAQIYDHVAAVELLKNPSLVSTLDSLVPAGLYRPTEKN
ncbi:MAG: aldo/keto reductase [Chthoniobacterales bacterium]